MTNVSTPLPKEYLSFIDEQIASGSFDTRAQFIRDAIKRRIEDREIEEIEGASRRAKMGEVFSGDLDALIKKYAK